MFFTTTHPCATVVGESSSQQNHSLAMTIAESRENEPTNNQTQSTNRGDYRDYATRDTLTMSHV